MKAWRNRQLLLVVFLCLQVTSSCFNGNINWSSGNGNGDGASDGSGGSGGDGDGGGGEESPPATLTLTPSTKTLASTRTVTVTASGGTGPYTYSIESGTGTVGSSSGVYTPPAGGNTVAVVRGTDSQGEFGRATITVPASGSLDTSFNGSGVRVFNIGDRSRINSVVLQTDGKIVAGGYVFDSTDGNTEDFLLMRLLDTGALDTTFNGAGLAEYDVALLQGSALKPDRINAVAVQTDGKIVAGGWAELAGNGKDFAVIRTLSNANLDTTFNGVGIKTLDPVFAGTADEIKGIFVESDGLLATGNGGDLMVLCRFNSAGGLDTSFGIAGNGIITNSLSTPSTNNGIAIRRLVDNSIAVAGNFLTSGPHNDFAITVFNSAGTVVTRDNVFDIGSVSKSDKVLAAVGTGSNGFLLAGTTSQIEGAEAEADKDVTIAKVAADSSGPDLDTTFNGGAGFRTNLVPSAGESLNAIAEDADGKIVAAGYAENNSKVLVARLLANGTPDPNFGSSGFLKLALTARAHQIASSLVIDSEGRLLLAGDAFDGASDFQIFFARLWP